MADRSHKFTTLFTKTLKLGSRPTFTTGNTAAGAPWNGVTNIMSTTVVISTTMVTSGWFFTSFVLEQLGTPDPIMPQWGVSSVNPGAAFVVKPVGSYATLTGSYKLHWALVKGSA